MPGGLDPSPGVGGAAENHAGMQVQQEMNPREGLEAEVVREVSLKEGSMKPPRRPSPLLLEQRQRSVSRSRGPLASGARGNK